MVLEFLLASVELYGVEGLSDDLGTLVVVRYDANVEFGTY